MGREKSEDKARERKGKTEMRRQRKRRRETGGD